MEVLLFSFCKPESLSLAFYKKKKERKEEKTIKIKDQTKNIRNKNFLKEDFLNLQNVGWESIKHDKLWKFSVLFFNQDLVLLCFSALW